FEEPALVFAAMRHEEHQRGGVVEGIGLSKGLERFGPSVRPEELEALLPPSPRCCLRVLGALPDLCCEERRCRGQMEREDEREAPTWSRRTSSTPHPTRLSRRRSRPNAAHRPRRTMRFASPRSRLTRSLSAARAARRAARVALCADASIAR